jgi:hypothetical protein
MRRCRSREGERGCATSHRRPYKDVVVLQSLIGIREGHREGRSFYVALWQVGEMAAEKDRKLRSAADKFVTDNKWA